jgi:TPP-dependent 2-oxoacid decarboxylase
VKSYESQYKIYNEVVEYGAILDQRHTAAAQIRKALNVALRAMRPVYLEVPRDMVFSDIDRLADPEDLLDLEVKEGALEEACEEILDRLVASRNPVLVVGVEVHRFGLQQKVVALAEKLQIPVTSSFLGRGIFPTMHTQFKGTYLGIVSPQPLRQIVEQSDCLLLLGVQISDVSLGIPAGTIDERSSILCVSRQVYIKHHMFDNVPLDRLVERLLHSARLPRKENSLPGWQTDLSPEVLEPYREDEPIRVRHVIHELNQFLAQHPEFPVVSDTGDCLFASVDIRANLFVAPADYGTMGFAVPAAIGLQASSGLRPLVLVGDGAFQMTGMELATIARYKLNPVVVVLNNFGYGTERHMQDGPYNDVWPWHYSRLPEVLGAGKGFLVRTEAALDRALNEAAEHTNSFCLLDVQLAKLDRSPAMDRLAARLAKRL